MKNLIKRIFTYCVLIFYTLTVMGPVYLMVITSLKPTAEIFKNPHGLPETLNLDNFAQLLDKANYLTYFRNSVIIVLVSLFFIVAFSAPAAFVFARISSRLNKMFFAYFLAGIVIPIRLGTISLLKIFVALGLNDNICALILINIAVGIPLGVFILTDFIKMIPKDLFDAASLDGCSQSSIFLRIIVPLLMPAIAVLSICTFIPIWNDFWFPLILTQSDSMKTVSLATALLFGQYRTNFGLAFATLTIASVPIVLFYFAFSKFFRKGLLQGAVKG